MYGLQDWGIKQRNNCGHSRVLAITPVPDRRIESVGLGYYRSYASTYSELGCQVVSMHIISDVY